MKNPSGVECQYFYGDYYRGRNREECRLLKSANPSLEWEPKLCESCPVPPIRRANSCEHMQLKPTLKRPLPLMAKRVYIEAHCVKTNQTVSEPHIGCGECHKLPDVFLAD